eukprot:jgi/Botrbrau1/3030/Bobra.0070s0026.1
MGLLFLHIAPVDSWLSCPNVDALVRICPVASSIYVANLLPARSWVVERYGMSQPSAVNPQTAKSRFTFITQVIKGAEETRRLVNTHTENMAPHLNAFQRRELALEKACQNQYEEALQDLNVADKLQPNDAVTLGHRGYILRVLRRFDEALQDLSQAVGLEPNDAHTRWSRAETLRSLGRYKEALSDLNQAVILDPNHSRARWSRGETLSRLGRYNEALSDLNQSVILDPNDARARWSRGETFEILGYVKRRPARPEPRSHPGPH